MQKILACISPSPSNPKILSAAADMAGKDLELIALFVETPDFSKLAASEQQRLEENILVAKQLGAAIQIVSGDDIAFQIAEYARLSGIQNIVLGQSEIRPSLFTSQTSLPDTLVKYLPDAEIHIIPDCKRPIYFPRQHASVSTGRIGKDILVTLAMLMAATCMGMFLYGAKLSNSSIMMVYLLGVLLIAVITSQRVYSIGASVAALFIFNFFFVQPRYSLKAYEPGYPVSFLVMFLTAVIAGTLANQLKQNAHQSARAAFRTKIISDTDQLLAKAKSREEILQICARQSAILLKREVVLYEPNANGFIVRCTVPTDMDQGVNPDKLLEEVYQTGQARNWCYPVHVQENTYALLYIAEQDPPPELESLSTLSSVLGECALALENEKNAREKKEAAVLAENERVRANLLRSISHDLRTPLMSISGNAGALLNNGERYSEETRHRLYEDIYDDSLWLTDLVENLLASTRMESGAANLRLSTELAEDILNEAAEHVHMGKGRKLQIKASSEILLVKADARLIVQVLVNLIGNALKYTQQDAQIILSAERRENMAAFSVADNGPGIADEEKQIIFDMYYVGSNAALSGRKSLGLGLALCKTIISAHGGKIWVEDNVPHGAIFTFTLPLEEVPANE